MVEEYYEGCEAEAADLAFYMPGESAVREEIFVARASGGAMDALKTICQARQADLEAEAKEYPAVGAYVKNARLVVEGDWLLFCVCADPDGAVEAFRNSVK